MDDTITRADEAAAGATQVTNAPDGKKILITAWTQARLCNLAIRSDWRTASLHMCHTALVLGCAEALASRP